MNIEDSKSFAEGRCVRSDAKSEESDQQISDLGIRTSYKADEWEISRKKY